MSQTHPLLDGIEAICSEYRRLSNRDGLFQQIYQMIRANWTRFREAKRWPSTANWVLRTASTFTYEPNKHFERQLQKQIAICLENQGWGNDVPTASGLVNSQGRHMNVDLAHAIEDGFELIELKVDADDPYMAACQIMRYGAIYMVYRLDSDLRRRFRGNAMLRAKRIVPEVLAPFSYYSHSDVDLPSLEQQLNAQVALFAEKNDASVSIAFRFNALPRAFVYRPGMDCILIREAVGSRTSPFLEAVAQNSNCNSKAIEICGYADQRIRSFANWEQWALPPDRKARQWKEHRSEFELARSWTRGGEPAAPMELVQLLYSHEAARGTVIRGGRTQRETVLPFGDRGPRCHDLALVAERDSSVVSICIEAKADEPFGCNVAGELSKATARPVSRFPARLEWLSRSLLGLPAFEDQRTLTPSRVVSDLPYQLFAAIAGTMLEAETEDATMAIFVVHEFRTPATDDEKLDSNANALNRFLSLFHSRNGGPDGEIELHPGQLLGPITIVERPNAGLPRMPSGPLFIGKVRTDTRG